MVDFRGICPMVGSMAFEIGQCSNPIFEFIISERRRVKENATMSEIERNERLNELTELKKLSQPNRNVDAIPYFKASYLARLKSGRNYYSQRPLHWTSSTVK